MKTIFSIMCMGILFNVPAQRIGISTDHPHQSSILDIRSDSLGLLIPRLTTLAKQSIHNPADGLLVFDTDQHCFSGFDSVAQQWKCISAQSNHSINESGSIIYLPYGEAINKGDAVILANGLSGISYYQCYSYNGQFVLDNNKCIGKSFITSSKIERLKAITLFFTSSDVGNYELCIKNINNGVISNQNIACEVGTVFTSGNNSAYNFVFAQPVVLQPLTQYFFSLKFFPTMPGGTSPILCNYIITCPSNGSVYTSNNGGANWTIQPSIDLGTFITEIQSIKGYIYKSDIFSIPAPLVSDFRRDTSFISNIWNTTNTIEKFSNYIGIALEDGQKGDIKPILINGLTSIYSGLVPTSTYYLGNTPGSISPISPTGVRTKKIGISFTDNHLLLEK